MTRAVGGSWDGDERPGLPHARRKLVLFTRGPDGVPDLERPETYIRAVPGGDWIFAHAGATTEADGPWTFD